MAATTLPGDQKPFLDQVFAASSIEESVRLYDQWASTYDSDMELHSFTAPQIVAETLAKHLTTIPKDAAVILDAGCGSGAVGLQLRNIGFLGPIDGLDISQGMLELAKKTGAYRELSIADLTKPIFPEDGVYDALTCCGTFTHGHLGPEPLSEFVRVVKKGGVLVATVLDSHWVERGFDKEVERLAEEGKIEVLGKEVHPYRKQAGGGRVLVLKRI